MCMRIHTHARARHIPINAHKHIIIIIVVAAAAVMTLLTGYTDSQDEVPTTVLHSAVSDGVLQR